MKFSKKSFKRLLCTTLSAVMLTGTMSFGTVFASTGKISSKDFGDFVIHSSSAGNGFFSDSEKNGFYRENGEAIMTTGYSTDESGAITSYGQNNQVKTVGLPLDKNSDIMGTVIFDIKADSNNDVAKDSFIIYASSSNNGKYNGQNTQIPLIHMYSDATIGTPTPTKATNWDDNQTAPMVSVKTEYGTYQNVAVSFKKDLSYDIHVNGNYIGNVPIENGSTVTSKYQDMVRDASELYFWWNVRDQASASADKNTGNIAKYNFKNFVWQKGGGELIAEADKATYSVGDTAKIKFSAPLASVDTSEVKVFESATGTELNTTGVTYENGEVKVPIPTGLKTGAEYRIELPEVTDVVGNKITNDNVYFNAAQGGDTYEIIDTFETFDSVGNGDFAVPNNWTLFKNNSSTKQNYIKKQDENGDSKLRIKRDMENGEWLQQGLHHKFDKKLDGNVSISYDIKPLTNQWKAKFNSVTTINLAFVGYAEDPENDMRGNGKFLAGTVGDSLGFALDEITTKTHVDNDKLNALWMNAHKITESDVDNKWFNVRVDLDFDNDIIKYYLDDEYVGESATLLNKLGLGDGIKAIGFCISDYTTLSDQLIDNVKVSHITNKSLDTEKATTAFSDDFSGYVKHGYSAEEPYHNNLGSGAQNAWVPEGWGHEGGWGWNSGAAEMKPNEDEGYGKVMDMAVLGSAEWHAPNLYHTLDKQYTQGVLTVDYDVNVRRIVNTTDEDFAAVTFTNKNTNAFNMVLYSEKFTDEQLNIRDVGYVDNTGSGADEAGKQYISSKYGKKIFGIDSGKFNVYKSGDGSKFVSQKDLTEKTWYSVRHVIDITNNSIKTFVGTTKDDLQLLGVSNLSDFTADSFDGTKIGGIGFSINQKAYYARTYLDNVSVTHSDFVSQKGVSAVRYSDIKDNMYGSASETSTLVNAVAVSFTDTPDNLDNNVTISDGVNTISYTSSFDNETNTYVMNLSELLTADKEYTLTIDGVTFGGEAMETYTHKIKAEEHGVFEISPISLTVNDTAVTGTQALKNGDTVKASVSIINTTGGEKEVAFSTGIYKDKMLDKFDYRAFKLDGSSSTGKYAEDTITFTMGDDAGDVSKVRAYLWDSMQNMLPYTDSVDINCK